MSIYLIVDLCESEPELEPGPSYVSLPKEFEVFTNYYDKLTALLQTDWSPRFVSAKIMTLDDENNLNDLSPIKAKKMMLNPVSNSLKIGDTKPFYAMLNIMKNSNDSAKKLATEIWETLEHKSEESLNVGKPQLI